jgi:hypothetical protein
MRNSTLGLLLVFLLTASDGIAERHRFLFPTVGPAIETELDRRWATRLENLSRAAYGGQWDGLAREAASLGEVMARARHRDPRPFAIVSAYRALAAVGLGDANDAVWHMQVALNLWPDLDYGELANAIEIAPMLSSVSLPALRARGQTSDGSGQTAPPNSRPPEIVHERMTRLDFLLGTFADARRPPFVFSAQMRIGSDGRNHSPRVLTSPSERGAETYSALEALRRWRFEPAIVDGKPADAANSVEQVIGDPPRDRRSRRF